MSSQFIFVLAISASNAKFPKVRRLSTISSVIAAAGHVFSTRWLWYWKDENGKWQSYDTPGDGHAVNTTSSQCFERDYVAGTITVVVRRWLIRSVKAALWWIGSKRDCVVEMRAGTISYRKEVTGTI